MRAPPELLSEDEQTAKDRLKASLMLHSQRFALTTDTQQQLRLLSRSVGRDAAACQMVLAVSISFAASPGGLPVCSPAFPGQDTLSKPFIELPMKAFAAESGPSALLSLSYSCAACCLQPCSEVLPGQEVRTGRQEVSVTRPCISL